MSDDCPRHPGQPVTAVCVRFGRQYCQLDLDDTANPLQCLSAGTHCRERPYCLVWVRVKDEQRRVRRLEAEAAGAAPATTEPRAPTVWKEIHRGPLGGINILMILLLYDEEFRVKIEPAPGPGLDFMLMVPERDAAMAADVVDYYLTKWQKRIDD